MAPAEIARARNERSPSEAGAWWMVAALFFIYVLAWLDRLIISMLVAPIKQSLSLSDFHMSLILGPSFAIAYAIFAMPLGWAADHFPRRLVIFCGVLTWATATVACGFANSFGALMSCRIVVGIGEAALLPAAYSLIADRFPQDRVTMATSVFQTAGKLGSATAFGLGGLVIALAQSLSAMGWPGGGQHSYWQLTFMLVGAPGFLLMFLVFTFRDPGRRDTGNGGKPPERGELRTFIRSHGRLLALATVAFTCLAVVGYSMTSWVPTYMDRHFGWEPARYGPALSMMNIFGAVALVVVGRAVDVLFSRGMRDAHLRFYSWLILIFSPAIGYAFFASNPYVFLALYALIQIITVPFIVYASALIALLAPSRLRGQLLGILMFIYNIIGFGVGPAIVGALTDFLFRDESKVGMSLAIVVIGGSGIAFLMMRAALGRLDRAIAAVQSGRSA
jgi:MFS family permease